MTNTPTNQIENFVAAIIQTLKADPLEMDNLIYNISPTTNDDKQHKDKHKDNSNNIIKYLEFNKNSLLDLAEKNYENLIEALTNNAMTPSSSDPTLSLPQSSSTFPTPSNQSDTYRIEYSERYHNNSRGDIAN